MALAWCFEDELDEQADFVLQKVAREGAAVPSLWFTEIANGLLFGKRRGRLGEADVERLATLFLNLALTVDDSQAERLFKAVLSVAHRFGLTAYDATYLELAMRTGLPLATKDDALVAAAEACGVVLVRPVG